MTTFKTLFVAASLVVVAASANAATREELETGYHGNTPAAIRQLTISSVARAAFAAPTGNVNAGPSWFLVSPSNGVIDGYHGN